MALIRIFLFFGGWLSFFIGIVQSNNTSTTYYDPVLLNGKVYFFNPPEKTEGNQFLSGTEFTRGTITLKGITFKDLLLNYDVYNQQLVLRYKINESENNIIVSDAWLERFSLNAIRFLVIRNNGRKNIYQVLGDGKYVVLYHWTRKLELSQFLGATNMVFSRPSRTMYLFHNDSLYEFRNNRGFISLFEKRNGERILGYIQQNKLNLRKADDSRMTELVSFINAQSQ